MALPPHAAAAAHIPVVLGLLSLLATRSNPNGSPCIAPPLLLTRTRASGSRRPLALQPGPVACPNAADLRNLILTRAGDSAAAHLSGMSSHTPDSPKVIEAFDLAKFFNVNAVSGTRTVRSPRSTRAQRPGLVLVTDFDPAVVESTPVADASFEVADLDALVGAHDFTRPFAASARPRVAAAARYSTAIAQD